MWVCGCGQVWRCLHRGVLAGVMVLVCRGVGRCDSVGM